MRRLEIVMNIIGTCSACGGPVAVPSMWGGINPPIPQCQQCKRSAAISYGPLIPMSGERVSQSGNHEDFRDMPRESQQEYFGLNKK